MHIIIGSSFINNSARLGGAIAARRGTLDEYGPTTTNTLASTIMNNRASFDGATIYSAFSELEIIGSTVTENGSNALAESRRLEPDIAAISTPFGDAGYDPSLAADASLKAGLFSAHCSGRHNGGSIQTNRYSERALFAYVDSAMGRRSGCTGSCAQHVTSYLMSDLYEAGANLEGDITIPETPDTYIPIDPIISRSVRGKIF